MLLERFEEVEAVARAAALRDRAGADGAMAVVRAPRRLNDSVTRPALTVSRNASAACDSSPLRRNTSRTWRGDPSPGTLTAAS